MFRNLFLAGVIALATIVPAAAAELKDVVGALEHGYRGLKDVQASFSQKSAIAGIGREQQGSGELYLKMGTGGSKFRFDYRKPQPQQIVSDGKTVWLYQPENRQVLESSFEALKAGGSGIAVTYLTGLGDVSRDFTATLSGEGKDKSGNYLLDLAPKKKNPLLARLRLTIPARAVEEYAASGKVSELFPVTAAAITDAQGNRTTLEFTNVRVNRGISAARFTFRPPAGTEVIRPGGK